jgi:cyclase
MEMNKKFSRFAQLSLSVLVLVSGLAFGQTGRVLESDSHRFVEVAEGVWLASGSGSVLTMSNAMVLVGEYDTLVVDSHVTPAASRALLASLPVLSDNPVRYLVNSHYHFDHAHGNQSFPDEVEIIGHSFTRDKLSGENGNVLDETTFHYFSDGVPDTVAELERRAAAETDPILKAQLEEDYRFQHDYMEAISEITPTPPNITLEDKLTLYQELEQGSREVQLLHFGRAHTGGDVVIFLPEERVLFTGDMMMNSLSYMGDGFVNEWPATLEGLKGLDFDILLPGHGDPFLGKARISHHQSYLRDLWQQSSALHRQGVSAEDAAELVDMRSHSNNYPQINGVGADFTAIRRIYQLLEE